MFIFKNSTVRSLTTTIPLMLFGTQLFANKLPDAVIFPNDGSIKIHDINLSIKWYLPGWKCYEQIPKNIKGKITRDNGNVSLTGTFKLKAGKIAAFEEVISPTGKNSFNYSVSLKTKNQVDTQLLCANLVFPMSYGGQTFFCGKKVMTFPEKFTKSTIFHLRRANFFSTTVNGCQLVLRGDMILSLQHNKGKSFYLRIMFSPYKGKISESKINFDVILNRSEKMLMPSSKSFYITPGKNWKAISNVTHIVKKNSALDFSFMQDAPAGKDGYLVVKNGRFELEKRPGKQFRLYGVNICNTALYLSKKDCEKLVETLCRIGYNSIRIHHYDNPLTKRKNVKTSTEIIPEMMDKLDYLFYLCKKAGLYVAIDFYCSRRTVKGEFKGLKKSSRIKTMMPIDENYLNNWKTFVRKLLTHKNPYTKTTWGADPTLAIASLVNEDTIYVFWKRNSTKQFMPKYEQLFEKWAAAKGIKYSKGKQKVQAMAKFLTELQINMYRKMQDFIRKDLNSKVLVTGVNYKNAEAQSFIREKLDYVDNHTYWNHPHFYPGKSYINPIKFTNKSPIAAYAGAIRDAAHARIFGKPFTITEFNYVYPNAYRSQGGLLIGSFASAQNWDGLYRFDYAFKKSRLFKSILNTYFHIANDPVNLLSERIGLMLFLRRDVEASLRRYVYIYDDSAFNAFKDFSKEAGRFPYSFGYLALLGQIGCINRENLAQLNDKNTTFFSSSYINNRNKYDKWSRRNSLYKKIRSGGEIKNSNGQIFITPDKNIAKVVTPRSEAFFADGKVVLSGNFMKVENQAGSSTLFVTTLTKGYLNNAKRMLMLHISDVQNSYIEFKSEKRNILLNWGALPLLQAYSRCRITLNISGNVKIWALGLDGERLFMIPFSRSANKIMFTLDNFKLKNTMAYEIVRL
jgi:hypothetical protein